MKKLYLVFIAVFFSICSVNSQSWSSSNRLYGTSDLSVIKTASDAYNNIYIFGYFNGSITIPGSPQLDSRGGRDYYLAKYSSESTLEWIIGLGGTLNEFFDGGIFISEDDFIFITGSFQSDFYYSETEFLTSTGNHDIFLAKYTLDGTLSWIKNVGMGASYQRSTSLRGDTHNHILMGGYFNDSITIGGDTTVYEFNNYKDYYLAKFESTNGDLQWIKSYQSINSDYAGFIYAIRSTGNNYYLSGVFGDSVRIGNDTIVSQTPNYYDTHIIKTDTTGNVEWIRLIKGTLWDYSYNSVVDASENIYITGYFNSDQLIVDSTETTSIVVNSSGAGYDFFVAKYDLNGILKWIRVNGGDGEDRLLRSEIFNDELHVSGYFSDTLYWGGIELTTNGLTDQDMFTGSMDLDGNYRNANSFGGTSNSSEAGIAVFNTSDAVYQVIQSNSALLVLGDSIYTSTSGFKYIVVGVVGCLPISIADYNPVDIEDCYGDSTGSINLLATGGFGGPWQYSIDNGNNYSENPLFKNLPAGDYQVVVIDKEGCAFAGDLITLSQPDTLEVKFFSSTDIVIRESGENTDGSITVEAFGGSTTNYIYWLYPDGTEQYNGNFVINAGDYSDITEDTTIYFTVALDDVKHCGPVLSDSIPIMAIINTGFETLSGLQVKVYPNPTSGRLTIEMPFNEVECDLEVFNMTGQLVLQRKVYSSGGVITETLDLSDQAKGLYMIRINGQTLQSAIMLN